MDFIDIFAISVGKRTLRSMTPEVIARAIALIDSSELVDAGEDGRFTAEQNFLSHQIFAEVRRELLQACREFSQGYAHEVPDFGICNSWANVIGPGQHIPAHKHHNCYISGAIYLTTGSPLSITNPHFLDLFGLLPRIVENNPRSYAAYVLNPEPGTTIMFPSGLHHGVSTSRSNGKRYSIAYNVVPVGPIGMATSRLDIRLGETAR